MECAASLPATSGNEQEYTNGVRLIVLNVPEDEGDGLGFRLTRTLWDPYPWVREVTPESRADSAGLKAGDCLLQADGRDLLGLPVGQVAGTIRGDGAGRGVSLLVWNCGVDPTDDPELLWSCGGGVRGERARRALAGVVRALACCVCASTASAPLCCARSHLYCEGCWKRLERCALCRDPLPSKDSPYARNLVAEQVFEAIATEYEIKNIKKRQESASACATPNRSPHMSPRMSPAAHRRGQYQLSMMNRNKIQLAEKFGQTYASDPNIHRSTNQEFKRSVPTNLVENSKAGISGNGGNCSCKSSKQVPQINVENIDENTNLSLQHKLVARLRQSCSLVDLQNTIPICGMSRSFNSLGDKSKDHGHHSSLDNMKIHCSKSNEAVFLLAAPPVYLVTCDHTKSDTDMTIQVKA